MHQLLIPVLILLVFSCNSKQDQLALTSKSDLDTTRGIPVEDTSNAGNKPATKNAWKKKDSEDEQVLPSEKMIILQTSLFTKKEGKVLEISANEYATLQTAYRELRLTDSSLFIPQSGMELRRNCDEICETTIYERSSNTSLQIPSNFDQGIIDLKLAPNYKSMLAFSSYDAPGYKEYYDHRSEVLFFKIDTSFGIQGIKPKCLYTFDAFSIAEVIWISDSKVALKVFSEILPPSDSKSELESKVPFKYYKMDL